MCVLVMLKNEENSGTDEIGIITPIPGRFIIREPRGIISVENLGEECYEIRVITCQGSNNIVFIVG